MKAIRFHVTNPVMAAALLGILQAADNENLGEIPELKREFDPYGLEITQDDGGESEELLPTAESFVGDGGGLLNHLQFANVEVLNRPLTAPWYGYGEFLAGLTELITAPRLTQLEAGGYTAIADGSGRISVGCQAFTAEEADELVKLYDKYKDRLPDKGDVSPDLDVGDFEVSIRRDDRMRLIVEIDGESIMGKYISLLDRFRKDPEKVKAELTNA